MLCHSIYLTVSPQSKFASGILGDGHCSTHSELLKKLQHNPSALPVHIITPSLQLSHAV